MPVSGVWINCEPGEAERIRALINARTELEVRQAAGGDLVVVTDTRTLEEDRAQVRWLETIEGVRSVLVAFSNVEDLAESACTRGER